MSAADDAEFDNQKSTLEKQVAELRVELADFTKTLDASSELSDLQALDYQPMIDKLREIETVVDNVPDGAEEEVEEEED